MVNFSRKYSKGVGKRQKLEKTLFEQILGIQSLELLNAQICEIKLFLKISMEHWIEDLGFWIFLIVKTWSYLGVWKTQYNWKCNFDLSFQSRCRYCVWKQCVIRLMLIFFWSMQNHIDPCQLFEKFLPLWGK